MPTVVLLDVSLSMARCLFPGSNDNNKTRIIDVACSSIINFFDQLSQHAKLDYTSLVIFSSLYEVLVKFTRDFETLKKACNTVTTYDKTIFETAFQGVETLVMEEWGAFTPVELILVTDGHSGIGDGSLREVFNSIDNRKPDGKFPIPFSFPCHLSTICLSNEVKDKQYFEKLIELNYKKGDIYIPESLSTNSVSKCFTRLLNARYCKFEATLKCGHFQSDILLFPPPMIQNAFCSLTNLYKHPSDKINISKLKMNTLLKVIGFLDLQDFAHPPFFSRHLVTPVALDEAASQESSGVVSSIFSGNKPKEIGFQPSFCVLLHGSLKMEKMGGIVQLSDDWYGMLHSYSDNKKRCSLMLSLFEPGSSSIPWMGNLKSLGPAGELPDDPYQLNTKENAEETPFPIAAPSQRSYRSQSNAVWIKASGLQSDLQKLLRYAKKLPDKQSTFFKEVNKIRRAGIIYGFHELLNALATTLEKEGESMAAEVNVQLRHVAEGLRNAPKRDLSKNIIAIAFRKKSSD